ncbi:restriction endonuclease [Alkalicoccus luteus]|uniref:Restriction endonuclease n=1 Tax=Alkalicoccus luteus TaxID=1237094 RepID=A0A969TWE5_9BACI|nr:restriction endonuclease [Alkalicoccus luteus]NJP39370.1 restriction endonuclease [Alkalicoccus luteus]
MGLFSKKKKDIHFEIVTGNDFEHIIAYYFQLTGAKKVEVSPPSNDGGKDVVFYEKKKKYIVECKKYTSQKIGRPKIQQFHSAIINENAAGGIFITTSYFTLAAIEYAQKHSIEIWDKDVLYTKLKKAKMNPRFHF